MLEKIKTINLPKQELANVFTHGLGLILSLLGIPFLLNLGRQNGSRYELAGLIVYCFSLFLVYLSSTIYHSIQSEALKLTFQKIDHISIYFLIAGTHTPFLLIYLNNAMGRFYLILLWSLVVIGVLSKLFFFNRFKLLSVFFYLGMGWMAVFTIPPMLKQMSDLCLYWIIIGGACYSLGIVFYLWERWTYHHAVWHVFVLLGSFGHFIAMYYAVQA